MKAYSAAPPTGRNPMTKEPDPHACIEIENHASLFSWLMWLAA